MSVVKALLAQLTESDLAALAEQLRPYLPPDSEPSNDCWLTVAEAADYIRCPKSRIYSLVSAKRIPHCKDGSRTLFRRSELDAWVHNGGGKRP